MKLDMSFDYGAIFRSIQEFVGRYRLIITSVILLAGGIYVLMQINQLITVEVDQKYKEDRLAELKKVDFDEDAIQAILDLNDSRIDITSEIDEDRSNPFLDN